MDTINLKKEKIKKILASVEQSAYTLIDSGDSHHPMDLVMELMITAYELDIMTNFVDKYKGEEVDVEDKSNKKVIKLKPKDTQ